MEIHFNIKSRLILFVVLLNFVQFSLSLKQYPQRSNNESALLEWGHSAMIHGADAIVAQFGLQVWDEEFKLGIEASPIFAIPAHGCQNLKNAKKLRSQMVIMVRGMCDFETKAKHAVESGAAALVVINDEQRPNHAFSMGRKKSSSKKKTNSFNPQIPCLMISMNSWNAISEDNPERLRLYPGGDSPFIESVRDILPSIFIIHNFFTTKECEYLMQIALPKLEKSKQLKLKQFNNASSSSLKINSVLLHHLDFYMWNAEMMTAIQEKMSAVLDFPSPHFSDIEVIELVDTLNEGLLSKQREEDNNKDDDDDESLIIDEVSKIQHDDKEILLTVLVCLDIVDNGNNNEMLFEQLPITIRPSPGMAVVYEHNFDDYKSNDNDEVDEYLEMLLDEEGEYDEQTTATKLEAILTTNSCKRTTVIRIFGNQISFIERNISPIIYWLFHHQLDQKDHHGKDRTRRFRTGSEPKWQWLKDYYVWNVEVFGKSGGNEVYLQSVFIISLGVFVLFLTINYHFFKYLMVVNQNDRKKNN